MQRLRPVLDRRHVAYAVVAALGLVLLELGDGAWGVVGGVALIVAVLAWAADLQTKSVRRSDVATLRLRRVETDVKALAGSSAYASTTLTAVRTASEQARRAAESGGRPPSAADLERPAGEVTRPRVLFVTSNGSGMGHLTRLMAIAGAGREQFDSVFVSLSTAAEVAALNGFPTTRVESQGASGLTWAEWNRRFARVMRDQISAHQPSAVVFDGVQVFRGVYEAADEAGIPLVWVCRGLWKKSVPREQLHGWRDVVSKVIVPTERPVLPDTTAAPVDDPGIELVDPITLVHPDGLMARDAAMEHLGLDGSQYHVLIQLGSGTLGSRAMQEAAAVAAVRELGPRWVPVVFRSPLAPDRDGEDVRIVREYPMSRLLKAFEFSVTSAGYNTVHENLRLGQPAVYVPDHNMLADDQRARAAAAASAGLGYLAETEDDIVRAVRDLSADDRRHQMVDLLGDHHVGNGAQDAARVVADMTMTGGRPGLAHEFFYGVGAEQK
ncbi:glycosyltransferase [Promicromonospora sukumoe]|uniref:glycosyltransferase n=1 Tax=Promicromonospora sukumoe TaxID=88382 RepID=UPI00364C178B